jgi:hypothetical protein
MTLSKISRYINVLESITASDFTGKAAVKTIFQPGLVYPAESLSEDVLLTESILISLRLNIFINSLEEADIVVPELLDNSTAVLIKTKKNDLLHPRFLLNLYLANGDKTLQTGGLLIHNRQPYYIYNLMPYFSSQSAFPLQGSTSIIAEVQDAGFGIFQEVDKITFTGAVQESSWIR